MSKTLKMKLIAPKQLSIFFLWLILKIIFCVLSESDSVKYIWLETYYWYIIRILDVKEKHIWYFNHFHCNLHSWIPLYCWQRTCSWAGQVNTVQKTHFAISLSFTLSLSFLVCSKHGLISRSGSNLGKIPIIKIWLFVLYRKILIFDILKNESGPNGLADSEDNSKYVCVEKWKVSFL